MHDGTPVGRRSAARRPPAPRLLIVSSIRWGFLWQRHQALAAAAAADGWQVDFLQPRPRNLRQVATYPLRRVQGTRLEQDHGHPPAGVRILGLRHWAARLPDYDLALVYLPDRLTEFALARTRIRTVLYDAVLDWATVPRDWYPPIGWRGSELRLSRLPHARVITDSPGMASLLAERGMDSRVVAPAADPVFVAAGREAAAREAPARRPAALYLGSVRQEVDVPALTGLAGEGVPVEVIGPVEDASLRRELETGGVRLLGPRPHAEAARSAAGYQVLVLPYRGERRATLAPAKYWNCVATGSWVVTHGLAGLEPAANVLSSDGSPSGLLRCVRTALASPPPAADVPTWESRWQQVLSVARGPA